MRTYGVLVVDDSAVMRRAVSLLVERDPEFRVVGIARNGLEALDKLERLAPAVVTMDVEMPKMDGLQALERIMREHPVPVVMLSGKTGEGTQAAIRALELGAVDCFLKETLVSDMPDEEVLRDFHARLKIAATAKVAGRIPSAGPEARAENAGSASPPEPDGQAEPAGPAGIPGAAGFAGQGTGVLPAEGSEQAGGAGTAGAAERARTSGSAGGDGSDGLSGSALPAGGSGQAGGAGTAGAAERARSSGPAAQETAGRRPLRDAGGKPAYDLLVIGCSTGGPSALQAILPRFPADYPAAIIVVQHMPPGFTKPLAERFNTICGLRVKEAEDGDALLPGTIYFAPAGFQTMVRRLADGRVILHVDHEPEMLYRPSVDVTLRSAAQIYRNRLLAVVLTGMGQDGLEGCRQVKANGGFVMTEAEESCVVYGMPKAVNEAGLSDAQAALPDLFSGIMSFL